MLRSRNMILIRSRVMNFKLLQRRSSTNPLKWLKGSRRFWVTDSLRLQAVAFVPIGWRVKGMKSVRVHKFGSPEVISIDDLPKPEPGRGEVVVRVKAAGIGPWDGLIRSGKSVLPHPLPFTLGSDLSGEVDSVGAGVAHLKICDEVFSVTHERFTGAYADYAVARAAMLAPKPKRLNHTHAASVPVVAVTAWQMVFDCAQLSSGHALLLPCGGGKVCRLGLARVS